MDADHPVVIRFAFARLPGVAQRRPGASQRAVEHPHHSVRVHRAGSACRATRTEIRLVVLQDREGEEEAAETGGVTDLRQ